MLSPVYQMVANREEATHLQVLQPLDFSVPLFNWQGEFPSADCLYRGVPSMESYVQDFPPMELWNDNNMLQEDFYLGDGSIWNDLNFGLGPKRALIEDFYLDDGGFCNDLSFGLEPKEETLLCSVEKGEEEELKERVKKVKRYREEKEITEDEISRYYHMPITKAAKELNIGLTLLKKKCREFKIPRWPYRKMKSLETLIKNVQELGGEDGRVDQIQLRAAVDVLEQEMKKMEKLPALQMTNSIKKLRQACFKANYKKRRLAVVESNPLSS